MEIRRLGKREILLKGKKENVWINPNLQNNLVKEKSRIWVVTSDNLDTYGLGNEQVIVRAPGDYEVGGVEVNGMNGGNGETIYVINVDGVTVGILDSLKEPLSPKKIERIKGVDVLIVSIEESEGITLKNTVELAKTWGANYLVPWIYEDNDGRLTKFLDLNDTEGLEQIDCLRVDKDTLPEGMEVVVLKIHD